MGKSKFKFWFDVALTMVFCLLFNPKATGVSFHEIAGLALGGAFVIHVLLNKNWVIGICKKIFSTGLNKKAKFSSILNLVLLIDSFFIMFSGLLISKVVLPNFRVFTNVNWLPIHVFTSILGLVIVGVHIGLHWGWIKQIGSNFPNLARVFTFRKPSPRLVSGVILVIGTIFLFVQVAKMVSYTPMMFSNSAMVHGQGPQDFGKRGDYANIPNGLKQRPNGSNQPNDLRQPPNGDFRQGKGFKGSQNTLSAIQLAGNIPNLFLYSTALGSLAFYTYLAERRLRKQAPTC